MGRAKLNMELISKEKPRNITFKKRKEGLIRKIQEFTILCDVSACMIIYGPKQDNNVSVEPEIWPQNVDEVRRIVEIYKSRNKDSGNKTFDLSDFFKDRQRKIEEELAKLRKKNVEAKYPTNYNFAKWNEFLLRELTFQLGSKLEDVKKRIEMLKMNRQGIEMGLMDFSHTRLSQSNYFYAPGLMQREMELEVFNKQMIPQFPVHYPMDQQQEMINRNSMMMLLMNDNDRCVQFGSGPPNNGNVQCASFKREVFYESGHGVHQVDPFFCENQMPMGRYYGLPAVTPPQTMMQGPPQSMMQGGVPPLGVPQLTFGRDSYEEGGQAEFFKMKNNRSGYHE